MTLLRYPSNITADSGEQIPYIQFSNHPIRWRASGRQLEKIDSSDIVALYMPTNTTVSDSLTYDSARAGVAAALVDAVSGQGGLNITSQDIADIIKLKAGRFVQGLADIATPGVDASQLIDAVRGRVINPNNFMVFNSPSLRSFPFNFTFIPQNEREAEDVPKIIRFFREASYPDYDGRFSYSLPNAFNIKFVGTSGMIRIPEVVCTGINVVYNPNSISYFKRGNQPVETTLSLTFQEIRAISKDMIRDNY